MLAKSCSDPLDSTFWGAIERTQVLVFDSVFLVTANYITSPCPGNKLAKLAAVLAAGL